MFQKEVTQLKSTLYSLDRMEENFLNDTWNLYFHDPDNQNWEIESYVPLTTISTVEEWIQLHNSLQSVWHKGMFFLMREHIQPIWEDKHNKDGGCLSIKVWKNEVADLWFELGSRLLGESLSDSRWQGICGISISPKRSYCIARIWVSDSGMSDTSLYNLMLPGYSKVLYKSHTDNRDYAEEQPCL